jgi:hypothetical protein
MRHGCAVEALCPPGHPLRHISGVLRYHVYSRINSLRALQQAIAATNPTLVIPCDDGVVWQLHQLYQTQPELQTIIADSLGAAANFEVVDNRERLLEVAQELNIRVPRTSRVESVEDLRTWFEHIGDTVVLKRDGTWGGNGVRVVRSLAEGEQELTRLLRRTGWAFACKRMVVDRDPLALWSKRHQKPIVTVQEFIPGRPANLMMACWKGQVLGAVTVEVLWSQGATGAAMVVRLINHGEIARAACKLAKRLELSGFHGLDFVLDADSGAAYLIEMNPRCTQLGHLSISGQGSLAGLLCNKLGMPSAITPHPARFAGLTPGQTIAFPKAFSGNPPFANLGGGYQDLPRDQPALMGELLKEDWPNRQWPARLYHRIRPQTSPPPTTFDEVRTGDNPTGRWREMVTTSSMTKPIP